MLFVKILCFGSTIIRKDSLAHDVADALSGKLPGFWFVKCNSYDDLIVHENEEFIILDVAEGINRPKWLMRSELSDYKRYSAHDLDLGFYLKLLKPKAKIFALPCKMGRGEAAIAVMKALEGLKGSARVTRKGTKRCMAEKARRKRKRGEKC